MRKRTTKRSAKPPSASKLNDTSELDNMLKSLIEPDQAFRDNLKVRFGRWLRRAILNMGITQFEFARAVDLPRDSISTYVLGKTLPSAASAKRIADFFKISVEDLLSAPGLAPDKDEAPSPAPHVEDCAPALDIQSVSGEIGRARIRVNRVVRTATALKIAQAIEDDAAD